MREGALIFLLTAAACSSSTRETQAADGVVLRAAFAPAVLIAGDSAGATMSVYVVVENHGTADTLDAIATPIAARAEVHAEMQHDGMSMMMPAHAIEVPSHGVLRLLPGVQHIMLDTLSLFPRAGDTIVLTLRWRHAGAVTVSVPVIPYAAVDSATHAAAAQRPGQ